MHGTHIHLHAKFQPNPRKHVLRKIVHQKTMMIEDDVQRNYANANDWSPRLIGVNHEPTEKL